MPDIKINIDGKDNASAKIKGVTGSIIKAQLVVEGLKMAATALINVTKQSVEAFKVQEQAEAKLAAQTGTNIKEFKAFASEIQRVTTVGDETVLQMQQLVSSMGVANDKINETTKGAIGLSKAFGIDVNQAAKLAANAQMGNYDALSRVLPALRGVTDESEKAAIVQKAMADGFKIAEAEAATFSGKMTQLKNIQGDMLESVGRVVSVVGVGLVDSMKDGASAINDFLSSAAFIGNLTGGFEVFMAIATDLGNTIKTSFTEAFAGLSGTMEKLTGQTDKTNQTMTILGGALETIKIAIAIVARVIALVIQSFVNLGIAIKETIVLAADFFQALTGKKSWKEVQQSLKDTVNAFKDYGTGVISGITDIVTTTVDMFKQLPEKAKETSEKLNDTFAKGYKKGVDALKDAEGQKTEIVQAEADKRSAITQDETNKAIGTFNQYFSSIGSAAQNAFSAISGYAMQMFETQNAQSEAALNQRLTEIDTETQAQLTALGLQDLTRSESIAKEIAELESKMMRAGSIEDKASLQDQIREKKREAEKVKILEASEKKQDDEKKKFARAEFRRKIDAFNTQKALDIVTAGTQMGLGLVSAAASGAQFGPAAVAMIPILMALTAAAGIASIAMIASKQPPAMPAFAAGVTGFGGGAAIVGEKGPEMVTMGAGSNVITNENLERLMGNTGGNINIQNMTVMANDPRSFADQMIELRRFELAR
jgi:hypothetical protein